VGSGRAQLDRPAELRIAQEQLDSVADDGERGVLLRLIEEYYGSHPKQRKRTVGKRGGACGAGAWPVVAGYVR
jgi:hypothetical protein